MTRKRKMSTKQLNMVKDLNKRLSKKKSNLKQRYGVAVDIPRIDTNLKGKELKQQIEKVESFLNPHNQNYQYVKNEHGVAFPKKEVNDILRHLKRVNKVKEKERKKLMELDYRVQGEVVGKAWQTKYANLSEMEEFIPMKLDLNWFKDMDDFKQWVAKKKDVYGAGWLRKDRIEYQQNYIKGIYRNMGYTSESEKIVDAVMKLGPNEFYFMSMTNDEGHIKWIYELKFRDYDTVVQEILAVWEKPDEFANEEPEEEKPKKTGKRKKRRK